MASGPSILARFIADTSQLTSGVDKATNDMSSALTSFALKAGAALAGAFAVDKVIDFAKGGVEAAIKAEQSANRLALSLKNVTGATKEQIAANEDFLSGLSKTAVISKGELRPAMDLLVRGFEDTEQAQKALALATDISAGTGKDLADVAQALMKAGDGSTLALRKLGIAVKDTDGKARPLNDIMAELGETFQGQAAAKAESAGGRLAAVGLQFAAFQTQVGKALLPAVAAVGEFLASSVLPAIQSLVGPAAAALGSFVSGSVVPAFQQLAAVAGPVISQLAATLGTLLTGTIIPAFQDFAAVAGPIIGQVFGTIVSALPEVIAGVTAFVNAFISGGNEITSSGFAGFLEGIGLVARQVFDVALQAVKSFVDDFIKGAGRVAEWWTTKMQPALEDFGRAAEPIIRGLGDFIKDNLAPAIENVLLPALSKLRDIQFTALETAANVVSDKLLPALTAILTWATTHGEEVKAILAGIGAVVAASVIPPMLAWVATTISLIPTAVGLFGIWIAGAYSAAVATLTLIGPFVLIGIAIAAIAYLIIRNWDTIKAATEAVVGAIVGFFQGAWDAITGAVSTVVGWITEHWQLLFAILTGPIGLAIALIVSNWDTITAAVGSVINWITEHWGTILAVITGPIGIAVAIIATHWDTIKAGATAVWQWVTDRWNAIRDGISSAITAIGGFISTLVDVFFKRPIQAAQELLNAVRNTFNSLVGAIEGALSGIGAAVGRIADAIKAPINAVLRAWNGLAFQIPTVNIPEVDIPLLGKRGGGSFGGFRVDFPDIPLLATGGVLTSPTMFVGGEAGTEIVAPESLLRTIVAEESRGGNYTLNLYPRTADAADVAYGFRRLEILAGLT
jgi:phage-related protein